MHLYFKHGIRMENQTVDYFSKPDFDPSLLVQSDIFETFCEANLTDELDQYSTIATIYSAS